MPSTSLVTSSQQQVWRQVNNLRSFPEGKRNCYTLKTKQGKNNIYLVRVHYKYENYDNNNSFPIFDFHLGVNFWTSSLEYYSTDPKGTMRKEVIHVSPNNNIDVCLINTGGGIPFISLLEVLHFQNSPYRNISDSSPLDLLIRSTFGLSAGAPVFIRCLLHYFKRIPTICSLLFLVS